MKTIGTKESSIDTNLHKISVRAREIEAQEREERKSLPLSQRVEVLESRLDLLLAEVEEMNQKLLLKKNVYKKVRAEEDLLNAQFGGY